MATMLDLRWQPAWISDIGCLRPIAHNLGRDLSWPWLFGASGYAFLLNIHEELCPSGWHCAENDDAIPPLLRNVGLALDWFTTPRHEFPPEEDRPRRRQEIWDRFRAAIDAGRPCFGYDLEIGDYYVVYGYDEIGYYYSGPMCDEGKGPLPWQELGQNSMVKLLSLGAVDACEPADDATVVREALRFAVEHAQSQRRDAYRAGLEAYDQWIKALEQGHIEGWGLPYNAACYHECRANAVGFLEEAKGRLDASMTPLLDEAAGQYRVVAQQLEATTKLFPTFSEKPEGVTDEERVERAIDAVKAAKAAEARGAMALQEVLPSL